MICVSSTSLWGGWIHGCECRVVWTEDYPLGIIDRVD